MKKKIIVIGGSAAGPKAASKARRMDPHAEITIIQKSADLSMASCGYPYYVGGIFDNRNMLIATPTGTVRDSKFFAATKNINAFVKTEVISIDRENKKVVTKHIETNEESSFFYDKLVITTGASPIVPCIPGKELEGVTTLQSLEDADFLKKIVKEKKIKNALIVGGGLIGMETCEALQLAGIQVTIVEKLPQILPFLDWEMAKLVEKEVKQKGVNIYTGVSVDAFNGEDKVNSVTLSDGSKIDCDLAVVSIGNRPNVKLAVDAGLRIGKTGGIEVNKFMQTSDPDIYAAGDCVEIQDLVSYYKIKTNWPMGDAANLQGRVVGQNITQGNEATYEGAVITGICKIFDYTVGSTGLSEKRSELEGYSNIITALHMAPDKPGFMGGKPIAIKLVADKRTGRLLGAQIVGVGDVSKRLAIASMALHGKMNINDLVNLDLPYAPPFSPAIDNFIAAAHMLENKWLGRLNGISSVEVMTKIENKEDIFILDVRSPQEFEEKKLNIGEVNIPLGKICDRIDEIPKDKLIIAYCKISLRGYEAACKLSGYGYENVKVMEGGILAWPF